MPKSAVMITPELEATILDLEGDELAKLQSAVDGYIEPVVISEDVVMWVNEEFIFRPDLLPNLIGSAFYSEIGGTRPIFGTVVITGGTDPEGYTIGLTQEDVDNLIEMANFARNQFAE